MVSSEDAVDRVRCSGQVMRYRTPEGPHPLQELLGPDAFARRVLFDMAPTTFMDSSGVAWLLACHRRFESAGGCVVYHSLPPDVDYTLRELLQLDRVLRVAGDAEEAEKKAFEARP
jgi:anti-anti-sigma regulatory factor